MFENLFEIIVYAVLALLAVITFFSSVVTIKQGTVGVTTIFGKYKRILKTGLNFKIPFFENVYSEISVQNQSIEMGFQATTQDQANVNFKAMLLFSVMDQAEETIKNVAFKFIDERSFEQALTRTIEGCIRGFVATKRQAEVLSLRTEIVEDVKGQIDSTLESWGYHLIDLQMNDITFDKEIMASMAQVVASHNLKAAAENEGQALMIKKTKEAEAEGNAIKIAAQSERDASLLRGEGVALFRQAVAKGMSEAAKEMQEAKLDPNTVLFSMWVEGLKHIAEHGKGNTIFFDGSVDSMQRTMKELMSVAQKEEVKAKK